eukprot:jgi/Chrzof1/7482/Cz02g25170.t1
MQTQHSSRQGVWASVQCRHYHLSISHGVTEVHTSRTEHTVMVNLQLQELTGLKSSTPCFWHLKGRKNMAFDMLHSTANYFMSG